MSKVCKKCGTEKEDEDFYIVEKAESGEHRRNSDCIECVLAYNRKMYAENQGYKTKRKARAKKQREDPQFVELAKQRSATFYRSVSGRAKTLFKSAQRRSDTYPDFDMDVDWIEEKLMKGCCEITGIPFDFQPHPVYEKNPFSPSIDRRDSTKGYTKDNTRIVIWQVNLMRGEMKDEEVLDVCIRVVEGLRNA